VPRPLIAIGRSVSPSWLSHGTDAATKKHRRGSALIEIKASQLPASYRRIE
jgi:hypothetical protein